MFEVFEMGEVIAERTAIDEIGLQMEQLQANYQEALAGGYTDMAEAYQRKMKELSESTEPEEKPEYHQGRQLSSEEKLQAHQGMTLEDSSEDELGAHQGSRELSFGSRSIKDLEKRVEQCGRLVDQRTEFLQSRIRFNEPTGSTMIDLESAKNQYKQAVKDLEWAKKHQ